MTLKKTAPMPIRPGTPETPPACDTHLNQVLAAYLEASESGVPIDRRALITNHPDLADPLREYFSALDEVNTLVADLTPFPRRGAQTPSRFGSYEVLEEIGQGGMGIVYRARQRVPDRCVALKMIRPGLWVSTADVRRFRTEGESAARLDHPNIVPIYEIGECDGQLFFSMKYCSGGNLAAHAADGRPLVDLRHAARLVATVARAVHHAHQRGILHRDLKPSNILLDEAGRPYVADFGLAKALDADSDLTATGAVLGTPGYLAPELIPAFSAGPDVSTAVPTTAVDVYGLGAILYFLLTGRAPFRGATLAETLALVQARDPASPRHVNAAIDRDLEAVCLRCLEKDPARRYASAEGLADDLNRWLVGKPTRARPVGPLGRTRRWLQRNPASAALAALVLFSATGGIAALAVSYRAVIREREASLQSQRETAEYAEHLRTRLYAGDIGQAHALWQRGESAACRATLDRYLPKDGEIDQRGWEWHYLNALHRATPREVARFPSADTVYTEKDQRPPRGVAFHSAFSPDGRLVASAWEAGVVYIWEPWTKKIHKQIFAYVGADANWVAFIGGGSQLVTAGQDGTIKVFDVGTGKRVGEVMKGHKGQVESIAITPDDQRLVSGGTDGVLRVWDLPARKLLHELPGHTQNIEGVALSPDGRLAATASFDGNAMVWDISGPEPRRKWVVNAGNTLFAAAFSPDGGRVAVVRADNSVLEYETQTGKLIARNSNPEGKYRAVCYVPGKDDTLLAVGDDGRFRAWNTIRNELLWCTPAHSNTSWSVSCSPDGRFAVTTGSDTTLKVWALNQPPATRILDSSGGRVSYLFPYQNGVLFQTGSSVGPGPVERLWNFRLDGSSDVLSFASAATPATAVSADGKALAYARADGMIVLRDRDSNQEHPLVAPPAPRWKWREGWYPGAVVRNIQFLPDGSGRLAALCFDSTLALIPTTGGPTIYRKQLEGESPFGLAVLSRNRLAVANVSRLRIYDLERDDWMGAEYRTPSRIASLAVTEDGTRAALGLSTGGIKVVGLPEVREEHYLFAHEACVNAVAFSPDGKTIASGCTRGIVRLWHTATGQQLFVLEDRRGREITSLAFTADGRLLVAGAALPNGRTITVHDPGKPPN
jgi:eukaryotic-like serine/threonine-protein kinase